MPHQTRSRGASESKEGDEPLQGSASAAAAAPHATSHAEQEDSSGGATSSGQQQRVHSSAAAATPEPASHTREGASTSSPPSSSRSATRERSTRSWEERGGGDRRGDHRDGPRGSPGGGPVFSPPPYKTGRYSSHATHRDPAPPASSTPATMMDQAEGREFDQLDLNVDFTGPEDPLMLGSFGEESPPRLPPSGRSPSMERESHSELKRPASSSRLRRSPPPHPYAYQQSYAGSGAAPYRRSPRELGYHPTPTHGGGGGSSSRGYPPPRYPYGGYEPQASPAGPGYGAGPRGSPKYYAGYPPYQYHPSDQYWDAPSGHYPAVYDHEDDIPPPPPSSSKKRPPPSSLAASPDGTPEKPIKSRSPFRSPPTSRQKYKRSPDFHASPHFGTYGSFGLDTPNATLGPAEFSPMGPSLQEFDENAPLSLGRDLGISRSDSQDSATPVIRRPTGSKEESSPLTGFMNALSPFEGLHGIARSPLVQHGYDEPPSHGRGPKPVTASGAPRGGGGGEPPRMHSTPHGSVKKALWPRSEGPRSSTPGRLRLEIGSTGALSTRKSLEGINSMMHSRHPGPESSGTPSRHESYSRGPPPPPHGRGPHLSHPGAAFRGDMATPIKSSSHGYHARPTPSSIHRPYPGSASKYQHHPPPHKDYPGSGVKARYGPPPTIPSSTGKENKKQAKVVSPKRSPCNCKKSKCLKLYCECFAAELFCKDCNCSDCGNTPNAGAIRDKAIKDTRAKNPNAFKPRFSAKNAPQGPVAASPQAGHNMGCRCKKSECLKKYCECFQAGVICGGKCKCVDCLNYAGSQALIDKRRKIKDQRGADFAMRVADEAWRQGQAGGPPPRRPAAPAAAVGGKGVPSSVSRRPPSKSPPMGRMPPPPHMMHPSPRGPPPPSHGGPHGGPPHGHPHHPPYHSMPPYAMHGPPPHGYPHMGMPMTPAGYPHHHMHGESPHGMYPRHHGPPPSAQRTSDLKRPPPTSAPKHITPVVTTTPRTPGVRVEFDPASSRKKRKISPGQEEATIPFFGIKFPSQPKTTALAIFSFLSNDDLYNAGLVCKSWSQLAMDGELWKFET